MARIRSIKPEMRKSLTVCAWPIPIRWTFVGLIGYVDNYGYGLDDLRLIKAELYPLDDAMTAKRCGDHLDRIALDGPLCRFEHDGRRYLHLVSWEEHQKVSHPGDRQVKPCPVHESFANRSGTIPEGGHP